MSKSTDEIRAAIKRKLADDEHITSDGNTHDEDPGDPLVTIGVFQEAGDDDWSKSCFRLFEIPRDEIESLNVGRAAEYLSQASRHDPGSVYFCVGGYCDDSRELYQIPEVCRFFGELILRSGPVFFHAAGGSGESTALNMPGAEFWLAVGLGAIDEQGAVSKPLIAEVKQAVMKGGTRAETFIKVAQKKCFKKRGWRYG